MGPSTLGASASAEMRYAPSRPHAFLSWSLCWMIVNRDTSLTLLPCSPTPACPLLATPSCPFKITTSQSFLPQKVIFFPKTTKNTLHQN